MSESSQYFYITRQSIIASQIDKFFENQLIYSVGSHIIDEPIEHINISNVKLILELEIESVGITTIYVTSRGFGDCNTPRLVRSKFVVLKGKHTYSHIIFNVGDDIYLLFENIGVIHKIYVSKINRFETVTCFLNTLKTIGHHNMHKQYQSVETFINNVTNNTIIITSDTFNPNVICDNYRYLFDDCTHNTNISILYNNANISPLFDITRLNEIKKRCFQILPIFNEYMLTDLWRQIIFIMNIII